MKPVIKINIGIPSEISDKMYEQIDILKTQYNDGMIDKDELHKKVIHTVAEALHIETIIEDEDNQEIELKIEKPEKRSFWGFWHRLWGAKKSKLGRG